MSEKDDTILISMYVLFTSEESLIDPYRLDLTDQYALNSEILNDLKMKQEVQNVRSDF